MSGSCTLSNEYHLDKTKGTEVKFPGGGVGAEEILPDHFTLFLFMEKKIKRQLGYDIVVIRMNKRSNFSCTDL